LGGTAQQHKGQQVSRRPEPKAICQFLPRGAATSAGFLHGGEIEND
jgi:hypothetical protein